MVSPHWQSQEMSVVLNSKIVIPLKNNSFKYPLWILYEVVTFEH